MSSQQPPQGDPAYRPTSDPGYPPPGPGAPPRHGAGGPGYAVEPQDRSVALLAHLSTLIAMVISVGWLSFVGPLIIWALYKERSRFVRESAAGAFNFNVTMWIVAVVGWIFTLTFIGAVVGIPLLIFSGLMQIICHILGAVRANRGELFRYPMQIRILS